MLSERASSPLRLHFWPIVVIAGMVLWSGWPVLSHIYGYNDDYHLLLRARRGELDWFRNEFSEGGRYLLSPLMVFAYKTVQEVFHLAWMRGFGLLGTLLLALGSYAVLFRDMGKRIPALAAAILISLTPATATWLGWAACFLFPFIATIALISGRWTWSSLSKPWSGRTAAQLASSGGILILCFSFYQPNAPFWIVGFWIGYWYDSERSLADRLKKSEISGFQTRTRLFVGPALFILAASLYFGLFRILAAAMELQGQAKRGDVSLVDLPHRLVWLTDAYTHRIFAHWAGLVSPNLAPTVSIVSGVLVALAIILHGRKPLVKEILWGAIVTVVVLVLSLLPMLASSDRMIAFRVMGPPLAMVGILLSESIRRGFDGLKVQRAGLGILLFFALGNALLFRINLYNGFVGPSSQEFSALKAQVAERVTVFPASVIYRFPPEQTVATPFFKPTAEYGPYSSYQKWVIPSLLQLILEERFGHDRPRVVVRTRADPASEIESPIISALEAITGPPLEHKLDPYWGPIDIHQQGWIFSEWFGVLKNDRFPEIKHAEHHYLRCNPREEGDETYWFLDWQTKRWFSTTATAYPEVYFPDTNQKVKYKPIVAPLRSFRDEEHDKWIVFF